MDDLEHGYVRVNGIQMHYVIAGSGPVLLLLHGFPEFWYSWRKQIAGLKDRFTVVAPDLRGYNETDKPLWGYETDVLTADVIGLIDAIGKDKVYLAGHDWGGALAWNAGIAFPHRLHKLAVLNCPHPALFAGALLSNPRQMLRSWYMGFFQLPWLPEFVFSANDYGMIDASLRGMAQRKETFSDEDIARYKEAISKPGALTAAINWYRGAAKSFGPFAFAKDAETTHQVNVPTMLIWGEEDVALGKELTYDTERYVPDLQIKYLPNCSHWVQQECPDEVNELFREFFVPS